MKSVCELRECPDCASGNVICNEDREQLICRDCGLVFAPLAPEAEKKFEKTHKISLAKRKAKAKKKVPKKAVRKKKKGKKR